MFAFLKTFVWYSILFLNSYNYIPNMTYMYINWFHDFEKKSEYIFIWLALIFNLCLLSYLFSSIRSWKREKKISCCLRNNFYSLYTDILSRKTRSLPLRSSSSRQRDNAVCKGDVPLGFRFSGRKQEFSFTPLYLL